MEIGNVDTLAPQSSTATRAFSELSSEDFLQLLITQITNQDPLEPMDNADLLEQLSSVRELELTSTLIDTLQRIAGQDQFSSASSLIGKFVSASPGADGLTQRGVVLAVRFTDDGKPLLQLSDGTELPIERVLTVEAPVRAAEALVGQSVTGINRTKPTEPELVEGIVTAVRAESLGEIFLELDNGKELRFRDVLSATSSL